MDYNGDEYAADEHKWQLKDSKSLCFLCRLEFDLRFTSDIDNEKEVLHDRF